MEHLKKAKTRINPDLNPPHQKSKLPLVWQVRSNSLSFPRPLIVGILNLTPDSFSDGGKFLEAKDALDHAETLVRAGADILDLGAESTRPGADPVSEDEELSRILPALQLLVKRQDILISIDTVKPRVAKACLERGADIINDVSGLRDSGPEMAEVVKHFSAGLILMHRRGNSKTMRSLADYDDVVSQVLNELSESLQLACDGGLHENQIVLDPGLGFAKNTQQNLEILSEIERFHELGRPVMLGHSRKSFMGDITGRPVLEREYSTATVSALAILKGIQLLRVHDVQATQDVVNTIQAMGADTQPVFNKGSVRR